MVRVGAFPSVSDHRYCQHFTLTPALSLKGEGELKDPGGAEGRLRGRAI